MKLTDEIDFVYPVGPRLSPPDVLQWSMRSVHENVSRFRNIVVVGERTPWMSDKVFHLPVPQTAGGKFENIGANLLAALRSPFVSDDFVWMNDDFFILDPTDELLVYKRVESLEALADRVVRKNYRNANYQSYIKGICGMRDILYEWGEKSPLPNLDHHSPLPVRKSLLGPLMERVLTEFPHHVPGHFRSLYRPDEEIVTLMDTKVDRENAPFPKTPVTSTHKRTWRGRLGVALTAKFDKPSPYERNP